MRWPTTTRNQWFSGGPDFTETEKSHDFRVGGHGSEEGRWLDGPTSRFHSTYTDIVEHERIVFTYDMWVDGQHISTSLTTIAMEPDVEGTGSRTPSRASTLTDSTVPKAGRRERRACSTSSTYSSRR